MANAHRYVLSIISLHMTSIEKDCRLDSRWWLLVSACYLRFVKYYIDMICPIKATADIMWFDVIVSVSNDLEPCWIGTSNVKSMAAPKGLQLSSSPFRFCCYVVSAWVTEHWGNRGATREHYQPLPSAYSAGCPTTTESTEQDWNTCILELPK